jgi:hypothetical protein
LAVPVAGEPIPIRAARTMTFAPLLESQEFLESQEVMTAPLANHGTLSRAKAK